MTAGERPRGGWSDARAPGNTERPRGGWSDARAPGNTERPRGGLAGAQAHQAGTDQGWAAPPLAPPKPRTSRRRGQVREETVRRGPSGRRDAERRGRGADATRQLSSDGLDPHPPTPGSLVTP